jgi:hypothetical protein
MTQGLLSVVDRQGRVLRKVVVGGNGMFIPELAADIRKSRRPLSCRELYRLAEQHDFASLVVQDAAGAWSDGMPVKDDDLPAAYRERFADPRWNPRWLHGTAEHTEVVQVDWPT